VILGLKVTSTAISWTSLY